MKKKILLAIICIILTIVAVIVAFRVGFAITKKPNEINLDNNTVVENKINKNKNTSVENTEVENKSKNENTTIENKTADTSNRNITDKVVPANQSAPTTGTSVAPSSVVYESGSDIGSTDKKQQAIELVKKHWGEDSNVSFRCDSVTSEGEYIVAVISSETASVRSYFRVNINTKTVEVDY